jgi:hypothetical protein
VARGCIVKNKESVLGKKMHCRKRRIVAKGALWQKPHCGKVKNMRKKFGMRA